ncbi:MAG: hypothetical protein M0C28_12040 [Candidatus Moduliflexus flocculans]|nr:hypothetical protein [Candidatus Moduliflexus flocculans]
MDGVIPFLSLHLHVSLHEKGNRCLNIAHDEEINKPAHRLRVCHDTDSTGNHNGVAIFSLRGKHGKSCAAQELWDIDKVKLKGEGYENTVQMMQAVSRFQQSAAPHFLQRNSVHTQYPDRC